MINGYAIYAEISEFEIYINLIFIFSTVLVKYTNLECGIMSKLFHDYVII